MKTVMLFIILLICFVPILAQDEGIGFDELCTEAGKATVAEGLTTFADGLLDYTEQELNLALTQIQAILASYKTQCEGLVFNSEQYPDGVTDPILIPDGTYRVTLETSGRVTIDITELDGRCGDTYLYQEDEQTVSQIENCVALFDIESDAEWTLTFEKMG